MKNLCVLAMVAAFSFLGGLAGDSLRATAREEIGADNLRCETLRCKRLVVDDIVEVGKTIRLHGAGGIYVSRDSRCISIYDDGKSNAIGLYSDMQKSIACDIALTASPEKGGAIQFVKGNEVRFLGLGFQKDKADANYLKKADRLESIRLESPKVAIPLKEIPFEFNTWQWYTDSSAWCTKDAAK